MSPETTPLSLQFAEEIERLEILIRETSSGVLAFAFYNSIEGREQALAELKTRLSLPAYEFTLTAQQKDPFACLAKIPKDKRAFVFLLVLPEAFPEVTGYANMQRETLRDFPHAVIFWMTAPLMRRFAQGAPDFWDWRTGTFDFRTDSDQMAPAFDLSNGIIDRRDLQRRADLYLSLLRRKQEKGHADEPYLATLNLQIANTLSQLEQREEAAAYAERGLKLAQKIGDRQLEAEALAELGWNRSDPALLIRATEMPDLPTRLLPKTTRRLAIMQDINGSLDAARSNYSKAADLYRAEADESGLALALIDMADLEFRSGNLQRARELYEKLLRTAGSPQKPAALTGLGIIERTLGDPSSAKTHFIEAIATARKSNKVIDWANALWHLGQLERLAGNLNEARDRLHEIVALSRQNRLVTLGADACQQIGRVEISSGNLSEARTNLEHALFLYRSQGNSQGIANTLQSFGDLELAAENWEKARDYYERAIDVSRSLADYLGTTGTAAKLAFVCHQLGDPESTNRYLAEATEAARRSQDENALLYIKEVRALTSRPKESTTHPAADPIQPS